MTTTDTWQKITTELLQTPGEFKTVPKIMREPVWFLANTDGKSVYVSNSVQQKPSCKLTAPRKITYRDFEIVYPYYADWESGKVGVRGEARLKSRNTAYIFALISYYKAF